VITVLIADERRVVSEDAELNAVREIKRSPLDQVPKNLAWHFEGDARKMITSFISG